MHPVKRMMFLIFLYCHFYRGDLIDVNRYLVICTFSPVSYPRCIPVKPCSLKACKSSIRNNLNSGQAFVIVVSGGVPVFLFFLQSVSYDPDDQLLPDLVHFVFLYLLL